MAGGVRGRGHVWGGRACPGGRGACMPGVCMIEGHPWPGGIHGWGVCMSGGCMWLGGMHAMHPPA